ncbi:MAG TPA: CDP-glycerol glycerophosphotransferase family protein [Propionibacteriaceae bacterium]|nr:CDP-glycerol glycerophosphotransferase family protein [Propionibacteriaceae bacterium]
MAVGYARLGRHAVARVRNQLGARRFARELASGSLPSGGVALFFATGPDNAYQFEQWRLPLEELAGRIGVFVVVDRPDTGRLLQQVTTLPIAFARGSAALEQLVADRDVRVVLYCNQVEANFRMLRFAAPVHIQIGHGESDKASSVSNQHKAYDLVFVGGEAGRERLVKALRGFGRERAIGIGRPQLDHTYAGAPDWPPGSGRRVLYAPTWEGDRPSIAYGSLVSHGVAMVRQLVGEPGLRVIYRPHPRTNQTSAAYAEADRQIRTLLLGAGGRHLVDQGPYGWQWAFADACITDISAVAYDWLATGKPLVVTEPVNPRADRPPSLLLDSLRLLGADQAGQVVSRLEDNKAAVDRDEPTLGLAELTTYYFGDTTGRASTRRFQAAIEQAVSGET